MPHIYSGSYSIEQNLTKEKNTFTKELRKRKILIVLSNFRSSAFTRNNDF